MFRFDASDLASLGTPHLVFGLITAWLAGVGRYWDHPDPYLVQRLGLGSLLIPVVLAGLLFALLYPLRPERWSYRHLLTFISLTSLPALLYAVPVERFLSLSAARSVNAWFLGIVAAWRVGLLAAYLRRSAGFQPVVVVVSLLLPLALVVSALAVLNLERAAFDIMSGMREEGTANDAAYGVLLVLTTLSLLGSPVLVIGYVVAIVARRRHVVRRQHDVQHGNGA